MEDPDVASVLSSLLDRVDLSQFAESHCKATALVKSDVESSENEASDELKHTEAADGSSDVAAAVDSTFQVGESAADVVRSTNDVSTEGKPVLVYMKQAACATPNGTESASFGLHADLLPFIVKLDQQQKAHTFPESGEFFMNSNVLGKDSTELSKFGIVIPLSRLQFLALTTPDSNCVSLFNSFEAAPQSVEQKPHLIQPKQAPFVPSNSSADAAGVSVKNGDSFNASPEVITIDDASDDEFTTDVLTIAEQESSFADDAEITDFIVQDSVGEYEDNSSAKAQSDAFSEERAQKERNISRKIPKALWLSLKAYARDATQSRFRPYVKEESDLPIGEENLAEAVRIFDQWLIDNPSELDANYETLADEIMKSMKYLWNCALRRLLRRAALKPKQSPDVKVSRSKAFKLASKSSPIIAQPKASPSTGSSSSSKGGRPNPSPATGRSAFDKRGNSVESIPRSLEGMEFLKFLSKNHLPKQVFLKMKEVVVAAVGAYQHAILENADYVIEKRDEHIRDIIVVLGHMVDMDKKFSKQAISLKATISGMVPQFWDMEHRIVKQRSLREAKEALQNSAAHSGVQPKSAGAQALRQRAKEARDKHSWTAPSRDQQQQPQFAVSPGANAVVWPARLSGSRAEAGRDPKHSGTAPSRVQQQFAGSSGVNAGRHHSVVVPAELIANLQQFMESAGMNSGHVTNANFPSLQAASIEFCVGTYARVHGLSYEQTQALALACEQATRNIWIYRNPFADDKPEKAAVKRPAVGGRANANPGQSAKRQRPDVDLNDFFSTPGDDVLLEEMLKALAPSGYGQSSSSAANQKSIEDLINMLG